MSSNCSLSDTQDKAELVLYSQRFPYHMGHTRDIMGKRILWRHKNKRVCSLLERSRVWFSGKELFLEIS